MKVKLYHFCALRNAGSLDGRIHFLDGTFLSDADLSDNRAFGTLRSLVADQFAAQVGDNNGDVVLLSLTAIGEKERRLDS